MITANTLICGKKIQLIVIKIMSLGYKWQIVCNFTNFTGVTAPLGPMPFLSPDKPTYSLGA
ncbi:hypothetical protein [Symbiopectobacterium sp. RP]|uniref:hypothetical protein n=1 Tax=Symbiopectobacterium sp. RP TaxID=3248553 RepID=UPI003D297115